MKNLLEGKKVKMSLVGMDGNAFSLMGKFSENAKKQGWNKDEISSVLKECMKGDYDHLIYVLVSHTTDSEE